MHDRVQALFLGDIFGRPEPFLGGRAKVDDAGLEVLNVAAGSSEFEFARFERDFACQAKVTMLVAMISEHQVDVRDIAFAKEVGVGLHPSVMGEAKTCR